jgi:hypothetical protein
MKALLACFATTFLVTTVYGATIAVKTKPEDKDEVLIAGKNFTSARFGVGISVTTDLHGDSRVDEAELVNGVVRIKKDSDVRTRVMLETHVFAKGFNRLPVVTDNATDEPRISTDVSSVTSDTPTVPMVGLGPFIAVQPGSDEIIESVAVGVMIGWRRTQNLKDTSSLNIGIGYVVDPNTQVLGAGIRPNQTLPNGETAIRYRKTNQGGVLLVTSFSF